jgi:hypothetical protein
MSGSPNEDRDFEVFLLCRDVVDKASFLEFAHAFMALRKDVEAGKLPDNWESGSIASFLDSAIGWADDSDFGTRQDLSDDNPWGQFAAFLYCGKIYE